MDNLSLIKSFLLAAAAGGIALSAQAGNTVMEPFGLLSEQYTLTATASSTSSAPGASGSGSTAAYNNPSTAGAIVASFTPGTTPINYSPAAGVDYGGGEFSTGLSHAATNGTGLYRIFFTMPTHNHTISGGPMIFTIENDSDNVEFTITDPNDLSLDNTWTLLATVHLTSGNTYTVSSTAGTGFVGQRHGGLMFEPIPEPSTYAAIFGGLALLGAFVYRRRARTEK